MFEIYNFTALKFFNENYPDKLNISKFIIVNNYKWYESLSALIIFNCGLKALKIYIKYGSLNKIKKYVLILFYPFESMINI